MDVRTTHRGERRGVAWVPVTRGAVRRADAVDSFSAELRAWASRLPEGAAFTHLTGAKAWGLWLPSLPVPLPVTVQVPGSAKPERPGLRVIRSEPVQPPVVHRGIPLVGVVDVLLTLCRDLTDLDALVAVDSALHLRLVDLSQLKEASRVRRRGAPRLRRVIRVADGRSESAWETVLREFHRLMGVAVTPQFEVRTDDGGFVARGDLRLDGFAVLHEYDGHHHLEVERQRTDLRRQRRLVEAGWVRRGYTSSDLHGRATGVLRDIDLTLGRSHDPARVRSWHDQVRASALTDSGRAALGRRLVR